jgi:hypothetical protein
MHTHTKKQLRRSFIHENEFFYDEFIVDIVRDFYKIERILRICVDKKSKVTVYSYKQQTRCMD